MSPSSVSIRSITTHDEMRAVEDVQRAAWNMIERDIVPMHLMVTWVQYGGILLGAFDGDELVGFSLGYPGLLPDGDVRANWLGTRLQHCSEMLAVRPNLQSQGIGYRLKLEQRRRVLAQGIDLMTWTFDPLLSRNAHLNITRLGGICRTYERNVYGELHGIYDGLPTDRLEVEWWLRSQPVTDRLERNETGRYTAPSPEDWLRAGAQPLNPGTTRADGFRTPADAVQTPSAGYVMVEVPADLNAMKAADMGLARAWHAQSGDLLENLLNEQHYLAAWFASGFGADGTRRSFYILTTEEKFELEDTVRAHTMRVSA